MDTRLPSYTGAREWARALFSAGLLFHIDDRAEEIVSTLTGVPIFTADEAAEANRIADTMTEGERAAFFSESLSLIHAQP